jgi:hypothetical protein
LNLAKVTVVKSSVKIRRYKLCSGVAAYCVKSIKRTFVKVQSFLYTSIKKSHCIEIIRTFVNKFVSKILHVDGIYCLI